jgi:hypothetical protein
MIGHPIRQRYFEFSKSLTDFAKRIEGIGGAMGG